MNSLSICNLPTNFAFKQILLVLLVISILHVVIGCDPGQGNAKTGDIDGCELIMENYSRQEDGSDFFENASYRESDDGGTLNQTADN